MAKLLAKLRTEIIAIFDEGHLKEINTNPSNKVPLTTWIGFLFDVVARPAWKSQKLYLSIVQLINNKNILIINQTSGNITCTTPLHVMMDSWA